MKQRGKEGACNSSAAIRGLQNLAETLQEKKKGKKIKIKTSHGVIQPFWEEGVGVCEQLTLNNIK